LWLRKAEKRDDEDGDRIVEREGEAEGVRWTSCCDSRMRNASYVFGALEAADEMERMRLRRRQLSPDLPPPSPLPPPPALLPFPPRLLPANVFLSHPPLV
jgi:hypothetical protein